MKTKLILLSAVLSIAALAFTLTAYAAIPHLMNYQGKATDKTGAPLNGTYNLKFRIYNTETAGTPKWTETQANIPISNGIFQVQLGSVTPLNLPFDESYWISIEINADGEMSPRTRLASVGYAYTAETANTNVMPVGSVVQVVNYQRQDEVTCNTAIPLDNFSRTSSEGTQVLTLAITPKSNSNKLRIDVSCQYGTTSAYSCMILLDSTTVLATTRNSLYSSGGNTPPSITYWMTSPGTSEKTFNVRIGDKDGTGKLNTDINATSYDNGKLISSITITEIKG